MTNQHQARQSTLFPVFQFEVKKGEIFLYYFISLLQPSLNPIVDAFLQIVKVKFKVGGPIKISIQSQLILFLIFFSDLTLRQSMNIHFSYAVFKFVFLKSLISSQKPEIIFSVVVSLKMF